MSLVRRHPLWALVGIGVAVRLVLAFVFIGNYDIAIWARVDAALDQDPLSVYDLNLDVGDRIRFVWPYLPLYLPAIALASGLSDLTGLPFHATVQLWPILADVGIAVAIYVYLGWRQTGVRTRLTGAALVMLGPCFVVISGYHGQFDQVAILPAVLALMVWERKRAPQGAVVTGLLVGVAAAVKTVPGLLVLPLLASARLRRDGTMLVGTALAVPVILLLPFLIADPTDVLRLGRYQGVPGLGGLSLVTDPVLAGDWLTATGSPFDRDRNPIALFVYDHGGAITLVALLALLLFLFRYRPAAIDGAVLLWLTVYCFSPNFFMHYMLWGLPFFIMAGYLREVAALQLALVPALLVYYLLPFDDAMPAAAIYIPSMIGLWVFWLVALATVARRIATRRPLRPHAVQPPLVPLADT